MTGCELATYLHAHQQQACTLLYTCVSNFCFWWLGCFPSLYVRTWSHASIICVFCDWDVPLDCTCVPRVSRSNQDVALHCTCVLRMYRTQKWKHNYINKYWNYITGWRVANSLPTYMPISSKLVHCCIHASLIFVFGDWDVSLRCTCVPGHMRLQFKFFVIGMFPFTVCAYLCMCPILLMRFHQPTRRTSVILTGIPAGGTTSMGVYLKKKEKTLKWQHNTANVSGVLRNKKNKKQRIKGTNSPKHVFSAKKFQKRCKFKFIFQFQKN